MLINFYRNVTFRLRKYFRRRNGNTILLYVIAFVVIFNELLIFSWYKHSWPNTECGSLQEYYKVLFVADPQILGENTESWIARWDSDRFLRRTYLAALQHTQPSVVVFLGDLMDEGRIANSEEFSRYFTRFKWIFKHEPFPINMTIFLPGDNDIGGEDEPVYYSNVERFEKFFDTKSNVERYNNLEFYKVNKLLRRFPNVQNIDNSSIRIAVSHIPLLGYADDTSEKVITQLRPHLIFSGHDHKSVHFVGDLKSGETIFMEIVNSNVNNRLFPKWRFQSSQLHTNEVIVPTCSYRMGVQNIGYGVGVIDKRGNYFCYEILWLPQRLFQLLLYLCCIVIILIILITPVIVRFFKNIPSIITIKGTHSKKYEI